MRKCHRLRRRVYRNEGPNAAWHADGYDKSITYGCIDGWSRRVFCLLVTSSNSYPDNIASYFLETVQKYGGCLVKVYRDFERKTVPWRQPRAFSVTMMMFIVIALP